MTIPDYHNQSRLPTGVTISLWDDRSTIFNVDNIETTILHPENYKRTYNGQMPLMTMRPTGSRRSQ